MAQKIDFIQASSPDKLTERFAEFLRCYERDTRYVVTPIGFGVTDDSYLLAVSVQATHKRTSGFVWPDTVDCPHGDDGRDCETGCACACHTSVGGA